MSAAAEPAGTAAVAGVAAETSAEPDPPTSWDLPVDIVLAVADQITSENSPFFDEADIASVAAKCMCVGHPLFTQMGELLYQFLSPRFGEDPGVNESSSVGELKIVLKSWGRPCTGKKSDLWCRIQDEVVGDGPAGSFTASAAATAAATAARSAAARAAAEAAAAGPGPSNAAAAAKPGRKRAAGGSTATAPAAKKANKSPATGGGGRAANKGKGRGVKAADGSKEDDEEGKPSTSAAAAATEPRPMRSRRTAAAAAAVATAAAAAADADDDLSDGPSDAASSDVEAAEANSSDDDGESSSDSDEEMESDYEEEADCARQRRRGGGAGGGSRRSSSKSGGSSSSKGAKGGRGKGKSAAAAGGRGRGAAGAADADAVAAAEQLAVAAEAAAAAAEAEAVPQCRCPIARGPKRRIIELQNARVTKTRAKEAFGLWPSLLASLPSRPVYTHAFGGGHSDMYALKDVKRLARTKWKSYRDFYAIQQRSKQASRDFSDAYNNAKSERQAMVKDILLRRGIDDADVDVAIKHIWYLDFFTAGVQYGAQGPSVPMEPGWLTTNSEAAANEAHTYLFHVHHTNWRGHLMRLQATHAYSKSSKYRQDVALEKRAFTMALQEWVTGRRLADLNSDPRLPPHLRPAAEQALRAVADGSAERERERLRTAYAAKLAAGMGGGGGGGMFLVLGGPALPFPFADDEDDADH